MAVYFHLNIALLDSNMLQIPNSLIAYSIIKIISRVNRNEIFNGIKEIQYTCQALIGSELKLFVIAYNINSHKWRLFRMLT